MPRPQTFDTDEVVKAASMVFWKKGYNGTTIRDLVNATGIGESSLYNTFGGKRRLFEAVLDRYHARSRRFLRRMEDHESGLDGLRFFILSVAQGLASEQGSNGCLFTNTAIELAASDQQIREELQTVYAGVRQAFCRTIKRAQDAGEITNMISADSLAKFLQQNVEGLRVLAKSKPGAEELKEMANTTLDLLLHENKSSTED